MFLPFYLHKDSKVALRSGDNNIITLLTTTFIDIPASSHVYLNLDLQLLCGSTFIQLIPTIKDGYLFIQQMSSTSTVATHEFKSAFIYNVTQHNVRIPKLYSLYTIEGLTNFPSNSGKILELKNLSGIVDLQSEEKIFKPQDSQLYSDSEGCSHHLSECSNVLIPSGTWILCKHKIEFNTH